MQVTVSTPCNKKEEHGAAVELFFFPKKKGADTMIHEGFAGYMMIVNDAKH